MAALYESRLVGCPLTATELKVLAAAADGLTAKATAALLNKSVETVKTQRQKILGKLGARNITQAVAIAVGRKLVGEPARINDRQELALNAKTSALAKALWQSRQEVKRQVLDRAGQEFGRRIEHFGELSASEASWLLDYLQDEIDQRKGDADAGS